MNVSYSKPFRVKTKKKILWEIYASVDEKKIGYVFWNKTDEHESFIGGLYVESEFRKKGIASKVLN